MARRKARGMAGWLLAAAWLQAGLLLPGLAWSGEKHPETPGDQECGECHGEQSAVWLSGKHGLMNVKCVVCHGDPESNFFGRPPMVRCRGCHGGQVGDVEKKLATGEQTCFLCHDHHAVVLKPLIAAEKKGFHQGGAK